MAKRGRKPASAQVGLNPKQEAFAQHLALHNDKIEAFIASHKPRTTNRKSIGVSAAKMMAKYPQIQERVNELRAEMAKIAKEQFGLDAAWVLGRLRDEAMADVADLYDKDTKELRPVHDWPEVFRLGLVNGIDVDVRTDAAGNMTNTTKLRFSDRIKRIEMIGRHVDVQAFIEGKKPGKQDASTVTISATNVFLEGIARGGESGAPAEPVSD